MSSDDKTKDLDPTNSSTAVHRTYRFVMEGGAGGGKSTIIKMLQDSHPGWEVFSEPVEKMQDFDGQNIMKAFFETPGPESGFALLKAYIRSYQEYMAQKPRCSVQIYERSTLAGIKVLAPTFLQEGLVSKENYDGLIQRYQEETMQSIGNIDGWIYIRTPADLGYSRLNQRGYWDSGPLTRTFIDGIHECSERVFLDKKRFIAGENLLVIDESVGEKSLADKISQLEAYVSRRSSP